MKYWLFVYFVLVWMCSTQALSALSRRGISQDNLNKLVGALLFKNGRQTTCEIFLMDMKSGLLSANCLDFSTNLSLNSTTEYEVYITAGIDGLFPESYKLELEDIHVHPDYNQTSLEYNIAVIEFNKNTTSTYEGYIYKGGFEISSSVLVRRSYNHNAGIWNTPVVLQMPGDDNDCSDWNGVYKNNNYIFLCNSAVTTSLFDKSCAMPFGTLYSEADGRIGLLALYSSTVVFSDDKCSSSNRWLSYYTYIDKVLGFVAYVLKRPVKYTNSTGLYEEQPLGIDKYISNQPASINYSGKTLIGGDIFAARDEFYEPLIEPTSEFWSAPQETSSLDFESSLDTSLDDSSNSSGLSRNQILAIAITIPLVLVCTATAVVLFYCRRVKSKRSRNQNDDDEDNWDPYAERLNIRELANEIRGIDDPIPPPTYNEVMRPSSIPLPGTSIETQTVRSSSIKKMQDVNKA